jgi:signal transduction histidine kinase
MPKVTVITVFLVLLGAVILAVATLTGLKTLKHISSQLRRRWIEVVSLMVFFILGYLLFVSILLLKLPFPPELVTGCVFFGGACFVYIIINLARISIEGIQKQQTSLINTNAKLQQEIAERKMTEDSLNTAVRELMDEKAKTESIISSMGFGLIIQDLDYKIIYENNTQQQLLGSHMGQYCYQAFECRDSICENCPMELSLKDGGTYKYYKSFPSPDGIRHIEITTSAQKNADNRIIAGIKIVRDITEEKQMAEQLRQAQKMEAIGTLTGGIAHEFNNILTSILGFGELLQESMDTNSPLKKYVSYIITSAERATKLTNSLLAYNRKQITHMEQTDINRLINSIKGPLSKLAGDHIELRVLTSDEDLQVAADKAQIEKALINIAGNAVDAMPDGGILTIRSEGVKYETGITENLVAIQPGSFARISVTDNGQGMDRATMERIFEPFFTTKEVGKGAGLGLSMAYGTIRKHKGHITVESAPGKGTTFRIYLPLSDG